MGEELIKKALLFSWGWEASRALPRWREDAFCSALER
jgi:hypothetical protein